MKINKKKRLFTTNVNMSRRDPKLCSSTSTFGVADLASESRMPPSPPTPEALSDGPDADSGDSGIGSTDTHSCRKVSRALRQQRNLAEKQRRDKLNTCIGKLAAMVPLVSMSNKRINKSGILRLTASYIRLHHGLLKGLSQRKELKPLLLTNQELGGFLLQALDGFMIIVNDSAKVVFVSEGIERVLGHSVIDVLGQNVLDIVHQDDNATFEEHVMARLISWEFQDRVANGDPRKKRPARIPGGISFHCSMVVHDSDPKSACSPSYKLVLVVGQLKLISNSIEEDGAAMPGKVGKFFIGIVKVCVTQPFKQISLSTNPNEVSFRSSLDGRLIFIDQRLSVVLGYMPREMVGVSGYEIIFHEDHPLSAVAHTHLLRNGGFRGLPVRLVSRTKSVLYFISWGRLIRNEDTGAPDTIFCHCTLISNEEGEKALAMAKHRFMPYTINLDLDHIFDAVINKNLQFLSPVGRELQFQLINEPPPKRPRGRPRKYPIGSTAVHGAAGKILQAVTPYAKNDFSVKRDMERFACTYAMRLNLNLGASSAFSSAEAGAGTGVVEVVTAPSAPQCDSGAFCRRGSDGPPESSPDFDHEPGQPHATVEDVADTEPMAVDCDDGLLPREMPQPVKQELCTLGNEPDVFCILEEELSRFLR